MSCATPKFVSLAALCIVVSFVAAARAGEIRRFSVKTKETLGRQLYQQLEGKSSPLSTEQQRALRAAASALHVDKSYRFAVLKDPERNGALVYAIATSRDPSEIVAGLHYRVTLSADGKVQQIDRLSHSHLVLRRSTPEHVAFIATNTVSSTPVETYAYLSLVHHEPILVVTPDAAVWVVENGTMKKDVQKR